jgi:hypothetical protein
VRFGEVPTNPCALPAALVTARSSHLLHSVVNLASHVRCGQAAGDAKKSDRVPAFCYALQIGHTLQKGKGIGFQVQRRMSRQSPAPSDRPPHRVRIVFGKFVANDQAFVATCVNRIDGTKQKNRHCHIAQVSGIRLTCTILGDLDGKEWKNAIHSPEMQ